MVIIENRIFYFRLQFFMFGWTHVTLLVITSSRYIQSFFLLLLKSASAICACKISSMGSFGLFYPFCWSVQTTLSLIFGDFSSARSTFKFLLSIYQWVQLVKKPNLLSAEKKLGRVHWRRNFDAYLGLYFLCFSSRISNVILPCSVGSKLACTQ